MFERYSRILLAHPLLVVLVSLIVIGLAGSGARFLSFSNDYHMFFSEDNPQLLAYEAIQNTYTRSDNVLFVLSPKDGEVFTRDTLSSIEWLTRECWQIPYSTRVDSITNYQHTEAEGDDLVVRNLVENAPELGDEEIAKAREAALAEPLLRNRLISADGAHTGVNITIQVPGKRQSEVPEVANFAEQIAAQLRERDPNLEVRLTGMMIMNNAFPTAVQGDVKSLYPLMLLLIVLLLAVMLRSFPATGITTLIILLTVIGTMGSTGWLGLTLSPPTSTVPVIVMTLAVADCVHIFINFFQGLRKGMDRAAAMKESLRINMSPVFLTSLTTVIGFLSLNFSEAPPFRDMGNMAAMGVTIAFLLSITLLPGLAMLLPFKSSGKPTMGHHAMEHLADFVIRHRRGLLWGMGGVILLLISQVPRNVMNDEFVKYFDHTFQFRLDTDFATEHLTGIYLLEYSLAAAGEGMVSDPDYLRLLERFAQWYREQPRVLHVNVLTDTMKRLNKNLHGDDPAWYRLPEQRDLSAQYLLLYEFSLPFGLDLNNQINVKKSATRMTVTMESVSTEELLAMDRKAQEWLKANAPDYFQAYGASPALMFANIGHRNIRAMIQGSLLALVVISLILVFALSSWRIGAISLLPNLAPIGMAFGLWGMLVGQIGLALSVVSGVTIGIVVDDTVHFLSKYLRARREQGLDPQAAVRYAFSTVGTALWVMSLVLAVGFSVLALSHFQLNAGMGLLTAITIILALVADFLFLPPLLMKFEETKR